MSTFATLNPIRFGFFAFFLGLGIYLPYFSPYLIEQGFSAAEVGMLLGSVMLAKLAAPPVLGWLIDRSNQVTRWLLIATSGALLTSVVMMVAGWFSPGFGWWLLLLVAFGLMWQPLLSQMDVAALRLLGPRREQYPALRAWGSIGFIVSAMGLGALIDQFGLFLVPALLSLSLLLLLISLMRLPEPGGHPAARRSDDVGMVMVLRRPAMLGFLSGHFLIHAAHGVYYAFFSVHLANLGYSAAAIGALWALGVLAEIILFFILPRIRHRFSPYYLLLLAIALMALRWLLIGYQADVLWWLLFAQLLHAASFGLTHAVGIWVVDHQFTGSAHARGMAVMSAISYGGGAAVGLFLAGFLWDLVSAGTAFAVMSVISVFALGIMALSKAVIHWHSQTQK